MILITGAAGKTGRALIQALAPKGVPVRALVRRPEQAEKVLALGAAEAQIGDLCQPDTVFRAAAGVQAVYHIPPNMHPDEITLGQTALSAARAAGVQHFVYHSVLHPQVQAMPHHWKKLLTEEMIFESGLPFTILQPVAYMQNVLGQWPQITGQGTFPVPYSIETRLGMVDLHDVAQAAAIVLTEPGHTGAIYELAGAEALTQREVAAVLEQKLGRPVRAEQTPLDVWEQRARAGGLPEYAIETLLKMFRYYQSFGFWGNQHCLTSLLVRTPTDFAAFIDRTLRERDF
jgi:uncharacterized protein YbjT (DUF2867 family)